MGKMLNKDETAVVCALLKSMGVTEVFLPRELLADAYSGDVLYIEDDFQRNGWTIRLGEY